MADDAAKVPTATETPPATPKGIHAVETAIAVAMPVMEAGTEWVTVPAMDKAFPKANTAKKTESGLTFRFIYMSFLFVLIA